MPNKWKDAKPGEKLLALYTTLMVSPRPMTLGDLADTLGCSKQTVSRLVNQLEGSKFGKVLTSQKGREICYHLAKPRGMPNVCINAEGLAQLALCMDFLARILPGGVQKSMQTALLNAANLLPEGTAAPFSGLGASLSKGRVDYEPFEDILNTLMQAIVKERICSIGYRAKRNQPAKTWDFAPKRLISYRECIYVGGYALTEDGKYPNALQLPLQRFTACEITGRSSRKIREPPLDADKLGIMVGEPFELAVRFHPSAATYAAERQWSAEQRLEELPDGGIILRIRSQSPEECIGWILSFGPSAELLSPDWLRNQVRERLGAMLNLYNE